MNKLSGEEERKDGERRERKGTQIEKRKERLKKSVQISCKI